MCTNNDVEKGENTVALSQPIFTKLQKCVIVSIVSFTAAVSAFASNIYFPAIPTIARDLSTSSELINLTVTGYMIFQALSPPIWGALSDAKGRRFTYIATLSVFLIACIPLGLTSSYAELLVLRCLQSTGSASTIAIGSGVIGDITTRENRGGYMGFFQAMTVVPLAVGPIIGGFLAERLGWRCVFWFLAIYGGSCLVTIAVFLPETLKSLVGVRTGPLQNLAQNPIASWYRKSSHKRRAMEGGSDLRSTHIDLMGWIKILKSKKAFSAILFSSIHYATWQMVLTGLSTVFEKTYRLSSGTIGLVYLANGVGAILGTFLTGKLLDFDYARLKRAGNGFVKEEKRLRTVWIWSLMHIFALLLFGWTASKHVHISVPLISLFFLGWAPVAIQGTVSTYLVDVYYTQSASATASMNFSRCLLGAGGSALVGPLIAGISVGWAVTLMAGLTFVVLAAAVATFVLETRQDEKADDQQRQNI